MRRLVAAFLLVLASASSSLAAPAWAIDKAGDNSPSFPVAVTCGTENRYGAGWIGSTSELCIANSSASTDGNLYCYKTTTRTWRTVSPPAGVITASVAKDASTLLVATLEGTTTELYTWDGTTFTHRAQIGTGTKYAVAIIPFAITCSAVAYDAVAFLDSGVTKVIAYSGWSVATIDSNAPGGAAVGIYGGLLHAITHYTGTDFVHSSWDSSCTLSQEFTYTPDYDCGLSGMAALMDYYGAGANQIWATCGRTSGTQVMAIGYGASSLAVNTTLPTDADCVTGGGATVGRLPYFLRGKHQDASNMAEVWYYGTSDNPGYFQFKDIDTDYSETGVPILIANGETGTMYVIMMDGVNSVYYYGEPKAAPSTAPGVVAAPFGYGWGG